MALLIGDYKRRVQSAQKGALTSSGWANDPVPINPNATEICPAGGVVTLISINVTATTGLDVWFQDSAGTKQYIVQNATVARDYKMHFYCPWPVYASCDVSATAYVSPPAKGVTQD